MKITLINKITLYNRNNFFEVQIPKSLTKYNSIEELKNLIQTSDYLFELKSMDENEKKLILVYEKDEDYNSFKSAQKYNEVIKLSLLAQLLSINPLNIYRDKVILHPNNIFYKDMKNIKFLYRGNMNLYFEEQLSPLEQYKLVILCMLTKYSYEKLRIKKKYILNKMENTFLNSIERAEKVSELYHLIAQRLYTTETQFFEQYEEGKLNNKRNRVLKTCFVIGAIGIVGLSGFAVSNAKAKTERHTYKQEKELLQKRTQAYQNYINTDFENANARYLESNPTNEEKVKWYIDTKQYDLAIAVDTNAAIEIVNKCYEKNDTETILSLTSKVPYLEIEKTIINFDYSSIALYKTECVDDLQKSRLVKAYSCNGYEADANEVLELVTDQTVYADTKRYIDNINVEVAKEYYESKEYDKAIALDAELAKIYVAKCYEDNNKKAILELTVDNTYIKTEKSIINFEVKVLKEYAKTTTDDSQLERMAKAFAKKKDYDTAKNIAIQIKDADISNKTNDYITKKEKG